jgi:hypothetical protein
MKISIKYAARRFKQVMLAKQGKAPLPKGWDWCYNAAIHRGYMFDSEGRNRGLLNQQIACWGTFS